MRAIYHQGEGSVVAAMEQLVTLIRQLEAGIVELEDQRTKQPQSSQIAFQRWT